MSDKKFYVYVHRYASGPKEGQVFYVGKGQGNRQSWVHGRSFHWNNIVNKYGFIPEIVMRFDREECSFSFERALIKFYGRENLCNLTDGGEGVSGRVISDEERKIMSERSTGRKHKPETIVKMRLYQSKNHPMKGKKHKESTKALLSASNSGKKHNLFDDTERCFVNADGTVFVGTRFDLNNTYDLDPSSTSKMINRKISHHKGWMEWSCMNGTT